MDETLFPEMDLTEVDEVELAESVPSETKWTYVVDYLNRRAVFGDDGRPLKTKTYREYLIQTAMKILSTERFQYVVYDDQIGVSKSEWPGWEDVEIKRDMEEALTAHPEIERAEVISMLRDGPNMHVKIRLTGLIEEIEMEEVIAQ